MVGENNEQPSLQEILQFDPFGGETGGEDPPTPPAKSAEGSGENKTSPPGESGEEKPAGEGEGADPSAPPQPEPPPAGEPPKPVSQAELESLIRQQTEVIRAAVQPTPKAAEPTPTQAKFNLGVPEQLTNALRSEDPKEFSAGVGAMVNGVANHVWNAFQEHLQKEILPSVPRMIEQYVNTVQRQEAVARDFYGKYPQLQIAELAPVIQTVGAQIAQEFAAQGKPLDWGETLRDAIAERIFQRMPFLKNVQQPTSNGSAPPRRSFSTGTGSRPPAPASNAENDMMEMIFGPRTQ